MSEANKQQERIPPPPTKPDPHECCGSGCTPCVFDYYEIALDKWKEKYGQNDRLKNSDGKNETSF